VREQLAGYQAELEGLPELDRAGVFLRLGALRDQVDRLVALPVPEFDPTDVSAEEEYADRLQRRDRWDRVLMRLERYVRVDFQRGKVITPLLDEAEMQRVRRTLPRGPCPAAPLRQTGPPGPDPLAGSYRLRAPGRSSLARTSPTRHCLPHPPSLIATNHGERP